MFWEIFKNFINTFSAHSHAKIMYGLKKKLIKSVIFPFLFTENNSFLA